MTPVSTAAAPLEATAKPLSQDSPSPQRQVAVPAEGVVEGANEPMTPPRRKSTARPRSRQSPRIVESPAPPNLPSPLLAGSSTRRTKAKGKQTVKVSAPRPPAAVERSSVVPLHYESLQSDDRGLGPAAFEKVTHFATETNAPRAMCTSCINSRYSECHFQGWGKRCAECSRARRGHCSFYLSPKERAEYREVMAAASRENRHSLFMQLMGFERIYWLYLSHVALTSQSTTSSATCWA